MSSKPNKTSKKKVKEKIQIPLFLQELNKSRPDPNIHFTFSVSEVTEKCSKYVKMVNGCGKTQCIYQIPYILPGLPIYDVIDLTIQVDNNLKKLGLTTQILEGDKIFIKW